MLAEIIAGLALIASTAQSIANVFQVNLTKKMAKDYSPKLYLLPEIVSSEKWDRQMMEDWALGRAYKKVGFTYKALDLMWKITVVNNGNAPATNVKVALVVSAYLSNVKFGIDHADATADGLVKHKDYSKEITIKYLPPGEKREYVFFNIHNFPEVALIVESLRSTEEEFITEKIEMLRYRHPEFELLEDNPHVLRMYGVIQDWKNESYQEQNYPSHINPLI